MISILITCYGKEARRIASEQFKINSDTSDYGGLLLTSSRYSAEFYKLLRSTEIASLINAFSKDKEDAGKCTMILSSMKHHRVNGRLHQQYEVWPKLLHTEHDNPPANHPTDNFSSGACFNPLDLSGSAMCIKELVEQGNANQQSQK